MAAGDAMPVGSSPSAPKGVARAGGGRRRVEVQPDEEFTDTEIQGMAGSVGQGGRGRAAFPRAQLLEEANDEAADSEADSTDAPVTDLLASNPEVEAQLSVEEEIERRTATDHTDTPHFRKDAENHVDASQSQAPQGDARTPWRSRQGWGGP